LPGKEVIEMEIQVRKLRDTLALLEPAVPKRATLPVLQYVRLGDGKATATDLEVEVRLDLAEADEAVLLPLKSALGFLRFTPGHQVARITATDKRVAIAVGGMETALESADPQDFPPLPQDGGESEGVLDGDALVRALTLVAPYAAAEQDRPVLTGIYLATGEELEAVAADGFRMAWERLPGRLSEPPMIIPARAVRLLEPLWKHGAQPTVGGAAGVVTVAVARRLIRLDWGAERLRLRFGAVCMVIKLIQGTFPNYRQLIPSQTASSLTVFGEDLERALRQVKGVAQKGAGIVRLRWEGDRLQVSARAEEVGETSVPVPAECSGPGRIALNLGYLQHYLKGRAGTITISPTGESGNEPVLFAHRGTPNALLMPMQVQWEPKPAVVAEAEQVAEQAEADSEATPEAEAQAAGEAPEDPAPEGKPKRKRKSKQG
jgi:DNA polymerase-3 subunit beta